MSNEMPLETTESHSCEVLQGAHRMRDLRRHVKCDETKPCCRNCIKWAGFCSGYESIGGQPAQRAAKSARTMPKAKEAMHLEDTTRPLADKTASPPTEASYRPAWRHSNEPPPPVVPETQPGLSRRCVLDDMFWKETMPQLVRDSDAVHSANLAVHTLMLAKGLAPTRRPGAATAADDYGRALDCYGQALRAARQATSASHADLREAVLCSLFFAVFETVNGDQVAAAAHLQSGQRILDALAPAQRREPSGPPSLRSQLRHVVRFLALQARGTYSCLSSSVGMVVDSDDVGPDLACE
ncbi:DNA replication complex GINS protein psf2 [Ophiocordyceps sinensis CO18]|uniref:DNA replication complex GINS protein psf2 n=1 Tax=Ophiocordyceps sinensis (strain Co18 / CGMCC 3.14243) TaxID=911162 RepID=T5A8N7_OPHSC|nr:DNA replication complex GINS protein psf2 [Ophiocordyceps sinensis CO18]